MTESPVSARSKMGERQTPAAGSSSPPCLSASNIATTRLPPRAAILEGSCRRRILGNGLPDLSDLAVHRVSFRWAKAPARNADVTKALAWRRAHVVVGA